MVSQITGNLVTEDAFEVKKLMEDRGDRYWRTHEQIEYYAVNYPKKLKKE
jgi:hypothetical protein